jgi:arsenate reductase
MNGSFKVNPDNTSLIKKVLFVCVHNSGRSQMAEALFNHYAEGRAQAFSAGIRPASKVNPVAVEAMREMGIDISARRPRMLTPRMVEEADRIITMGCGVEGICPATFVPTEDWQLDDPEGKPVYRVREIREEIECRVKKLIKEIQYEGGIKSNA